jgi:hypothetical protein
MEENMSQEDTILVRGPGGIFEMSLPLPETIAERLANGELEEIEKEIDDEPKPVRPSPNSIPRKKLVRSNTIQRRK